MQSSIAKNQLDEDKIINVFSEGLYKNITTISNNEKIETIAIFTDISKGIEELEDLGIDNYQPLKIINAISFKANKNQLEYLASSEYIKKLYEDRIFRISRDESTELLGVDDFRSKQILNKTINGSGVKVGIIDTGLDYTHPEFNCTSPSTCQLKKGISYVYAGYNENTRTKELNDFNQLIVPESFTFNESDWLSLDMRIDSEIMGSKLKFSLFSQNSNHFLVSLEDKVLINTTLNNQTNITINRFYEKEKDFLINANQSFNSYFSLSFNKNCIINRGVFKINGVDSGSGYPSNITIRIFNTTIIHDGDLDSETLINLKTALEDAKSNCSTTNINKTEFCIIPVRISSERAGIINISGLSLNITSNNPIRSSYDIDSELSYVENLTKGCDGEHGYCEIKLNFESNSETTISIERLSINYSYTLFEPKGSFYDDHGHGTHVAGIIRSVAPGSDLYIYKALDSYGGGSESDIIKSISMAVEDDVDVLSMSLGSGSYSDNCDTDPIGLAVNRAVREGVAVVVATGNEYQSDAVASPACASESIAVGAIDKSNEIASFSNKGKLVDVVNYGVDVTSTVPTRWCSMCDDSGYATASGTSMATPFVSGLIALYIQAHEVVHGSSPSPGYVEEIMKRTANDLGIHGRDNIFGYGVPNINKMAASLDYWSSVTCPQKMIRFDGSETGIINESFMIVQEGIQRNITISVNWTNLTSGSKEIQMNIDGKQKEFIKTLSGSRHFVAEIDPGSGAAQGDYSGAITVKVLQTNEMFTIPVYYKNDNILNFIEGFSFASGTVAYQENDFFKFFIDSTVTALTLQLFWKSANYDLDMILKNNKDYDMIITSKESPDPEKSLIKKRKLADHKIFKNFQ